MLLDLPLSLEWIKALLPAFLLLMTWIIGTRVLHSWDIKKKRKETDISIASEFYKLYGEFTSVWRLWKVYRDVNPVKSDLKDKTLEQYWELLMRSSNVEGGMEAVFVKLASEKKLCPKDMYSLGLFRQAIQQLRQSIRNYDEMNWRRPHTEYKLLKKLSAYVATLINKRNKKKPPDSILAAQQLTKIMEVDSRIWKNNVGTRRSYWHEMAESKLQQNGSGI